MDSDLQPAQGVLPSIANRVRVVIALHALEINKTSNTGMLAARCLTNSHWLTFGERDGISLSDQVAAMPLTGAAILFPDDTAACLTRYQPRSLIVPDGTWRQCSKAARRLHRDLGIPMVSLPTGPGSDYRLRRVPHPDRWSTIESVAHAIDALEGGGIGAGLLESFQRVHDRILWVKGRKSRSAVRGGIPVGLRRSDLHQWTT